MVECDGKSLKLTLQWGDASLPFISFTKTFRFCIDDTVWIAKQAVLLEFAALNLSDPLNYGFYMPPYKGKAGKFLSEERLLRDYPVEGYGDHLEFRYKRRIFRSINSDEKKLQKFQNKNYQRKFIELLLTANYEKSKQLLEKGLDPNFQDEKTGETPLTALAVIPNSSEGCMLLVNYGAYLDYRSADGMTALHKATIHDRPDCLSNLLDLGASPNYKDAKGLTPLYHGILAGSKGDTCELLLNEKAVIGITDHQGSQEIHQACRNGRETHLDHLIFYGADVNSRTAGGNTPLHICAISNQESCARLLLFRGADKSLSNYSHQTAYEVAVITGNHDVASLIEDFNSDHVTLFAQKPTYSRRRRISAVPNKASAINNSIAENTQEIQRSCTLPSRTDLNCNNEKMFLKNTRKASKSHPNGNVDLEPKAAVEVEESGSEDSDSDEETNKSNRIDRRTFTSSGVGSRRAPAPIKSIQGANLKNRLYPSIPGRQFVAVVDYQPKAPGELLMEKGDVVELLYIGEQGFWEGRVNDRTGWFPSACVEELKKTNKKAKNRTWFGKKSGQKDIIQKAAMQDNPTPKTIQVKRGERGYGFQLRGANSHMARIEFTPSPQFPALQYIGEIDKGEAAEKVGLKPGDFILEVNGEDVKNTTHGHVVSLVANSGKSLTLKVVTVAAENMAAALALETPNMKQPVNQIPVRGEEKVDDAQRGSKIAPPPLPRSQYTSLTMGPLHRPASAVVSDGQVSPGNVDTVMTLDKKVQRKRSMKSMWTDNALKLNQPDTVISEEISKGVIRRGKVMSMNIPSDFNYSDTDSGLAPRSCSISSRSSNCSDGLVIDATRMHLNATMPRRASRSNSQGSLESDNSNRPQQPPNYEDTLENMRRVGRKPSINRGDSESRIQCQIEQSTLKQSNEHGDSIALPAIPSYAPPSPPEATKAPKTPVRSVSVPGPPVTALHPSFDRSSSQPCQASSDEDEPSSEFAKSLLSVVAARNSRLRNKKLSIDEAVNLRKKEQNLHVIKENEEANRPFDSGRMTKSSSSDALLQNSKGGDSFSLYTASSTSSLDTQYSKDSGIDVSEVIAQAPGEQPPDLASALANAVARRAEKIANKDVLVSTDPSKGHKSGNPAEKSLTTSLIEKSKHEDKVFPAVKLKKVSNASEHSQNLSQIIQRKSSAASEQVKTPPPTRPKPKAQQKRSAESLSTEFLDDAIAAGNISVEYDAVSTTSASSLEAFSSAQDIVTPPIMFAATGQPFSTSQGTESAVDDDKDALPPPPSEFLAVSDSIKDERHAETQPTASLDPSDPPPPYSPPRMKTDLPSALSEKAYMKWSVEDVGLWLDFINMGQYKESFIENDIQGIHLSELSKEDLSELGVKKLGHRLTIDDSIGKLSRNKQFSEV